MRQLARCRIWPCLLLMTLALVTRDASTSGPPTVEELKPSPAPIGGEMRNLGVPRQLTRWSYTDAEGKTKTYVDVYMTVWTDSGNSQYKDFHLREDGTVMVKGTKLFISVGTPIRQFGFMETCAFNLQLKKNGIWVDKTTEGVPREPLLRRVLVEERVIVEIMKRSTTEPHNKGVREGDNHSVNVDMKYESNQIGLSDEDARIFEAHILPRSLITYVRGSPKDFDMYSDIQDRSGLMLSLSVLREEVDIPQNSGPYPSLFTRLDTEVKDNEVPTTALKHIDPRFPVKTTELSEEDRNTEAAKFLIERLKEDASSLKADVSIEEVETFFRERSEAVNRFLEVKETHKRSGKLLEQSENHVRQRKLELHPVYTGRPEVIPEAVDLSVKRVQFFVRETGVRTVSHWVSGKSDYDNTYKRIDKTLKSNREVYDLRKAEKHLQGEKIMLAKIIEDKNRVDGVDKRELMRDTFEKEESHLRIITDSEEKFNEIKKQRLKKDKYLRVSWVEPRKNTVLLVHGKTEMFVHFTGEDVSDSKRTEEAFKVLSDINSRCKGMHSGTLTVEVSTRLREDILKALVKEVDKVINSQASPNEVVLRSATEGTEVRINCKTKQLFEGQAPPRTWVVTKQGTFVINNIYIRDPTLQETLKKFLSIQSLDNVPNEVLLVEKINPMANKDYSRIKSEKIDKYCNIVTSNPLKITTIR